MWRPRECCSGQRWGTVEGAATEEEAVGAAGAAAADVAAERQGRGGVAAVGEAVHINTYEIAFY